MKIGTPEIVDVQMEEYVAIIIDDEKNIREALLILLGQYCPEIHVCGTADSAIEGRKLLENNKVDFIFLDISMPREDGFAFLNSIPNNNYGVIFATAHQEHALRALKANAIDYLLKPINPFELKEAVNKAIYNHEMRRNYSEIRDVYNQSLHNLQENIQSKNNRITKITVIDVNGFQIVNVDDLVYMESENNYTSLFLTNEKKIISTRTLGDYERLLEGTSFFRIHKSYIINFNYLSGYSKNQGNFAELKDGSKLTISRRKLDEFLEKVKQLAIEFE